MTTLATRVRRESWGFAAGSVLFLVGALPAYANAVGPVADAATFAAGAVLFTLAAFIQLAVSGRRPPRRASTLAAWWDWMSAAIQFLGTLLFNVSTIAVLMAALRDPDRLTAGWIPDVWGSACFLIAGILAVMAARRRHELWDVRARTWHGTLLNLVGSVAFGVAAVGAWVVPDTGELFSERWMNVGTAFGALCFLIAAVLARRAADAGNTRPDAGG